MSAVHEARVGLPVVSARRKATDRVARGLIAAMTLITVVPLVLVVYFLIARGAGAWTAEFFTTDPTGSVLGDPGGMRSAYLGTLVIVALAALISIPVGIGIGVYLVDYGRRSRFAGIVRYFVDVMTGVPSIVFGLFVYIVLVVSHVGGSASAAWKGSIALALLMMPVVARSSEVVLSLVPDSLREAALALGTPRWRVVMRIVLPTALPGLITGSLLAIARGAGETAPLLFTVSITNGTSFDLNNLMDSLPMQVFGNIGSPNPALVERGWGAALLLVTMVLVATAIARLAARRSRL
ncbi:MAG TPA: phosphate ABC transporter permease PstA [Solirubrobacteraceae bacterium]|nr:phosphate ABC transporter permease PstA [Solirubrobacteraceae bacterium]